MTRSSRALLACLAFSSCVHDGERVALAESLGATTVVVLDAARARRIETEIYFAARGVPRREPRAFIYALDVARDAEPAFVDARPLVVISHGSGGTRHDMHWLARALVESGFVVVAPAHPGNTFGDSDILRALEPWQRPQDVSAVIDALLVHPSWGPRIDASRIAIVGHSAGGYTALASVGATYSIAHAEQKCRVTVGDPTCELVKPIDRSSIDYSRSGDDYSDPRIRAAVAFAPAVGEAANPETAQRVQRPILIFGAKRDQLTPFDGHAAHWHALLPSSTMVALDDADHYAFIAPCLPHGALVADACRDPAGFDRAATQRAIVGRVRAFLIDAFRAPPVIASSRAARVEVGP